MSLQNVAKWQSMWELRNFGLNQSGGPSDPDCLRIEGRHPESHIERMTKRICRTKSKTISKKFVKWAQIVTCRLCEMDKNYVTKKYETSIC